MERQALWLRCALVTVDTDKWSEYFRSDKWFFIDEIEVALQGLGVEVGHGDGGCKEMQKTPSTFG